MSSTSKRPPLAAIFGLALSIAEQYSAAGTHEIGGNNHGDQVEFFLRLAGTRPGQPWCCAFVFACLVKAWCRLSGISETRESMEVNLARFVRETTIPRTASCWVMWQALKRLGLARDKNASAPSGSIVFFHFHGEPIPKHIGFVRSWPETIEGNTPEGAAGNQADGDGVLAKVRGRSVVFGFAVAA